MEPWQSWTIISIAGAAAYLYYSRASRFKRGRGPTPSIASKIQTHDAKSPDRSRTQRKRVKNADALEKSASDVAEVSAGSVPPTDKGLKKRKGGKKPVGQLAQSSAVDVSGPVLPPMDSDGGMGHDIDNVEFAKRLAGLKAGTPLNKPSGMADTRKTQKPGKQDEAPQVMVNGVGHAADESRNPKGVSTASSTTGADADDDLSPAISPELGATRTPTSAGDISDMLEVPKSGPSVLRLTDPATSQPIRQPKPPKPAQEQETKKQRQNRRKNEEKKMVREEEEKERRVRLEKQRRTAREAEGRPAKNGLGPSQPPAASAWDRPGLQDGPKYSNVMGHGDGLLDTFDRTTTATAHPPQDARDGKSTADKAWKSDLPSEEEQMRLLTEIDGNDGWNTVKSGKAKKKTGDAGGKVPGSDEKAPSADGSGSAAEWKSATKADGASQGGNPGESTNSTTSDSGVEVSQPEADSPGTPGPSPLAKPMADPKVWNRDNIHNHPDYDSRYPWALTGHPDDSDWAVV
jgi:hypothetical protein